MVTLIVYSNINPGSTPEVTRLAEIPNFPASSDLGREQLHRPAWGRSFLVGPGVFRF